MLLPLAFCAVAGLCVSGLFLLLLEGKPEISKSTFSYDRASDTYRVDGLVRVPLGGEVHVLGWRRPVATRTVPFSLEKPGKSISSKWVEEEASAIAGRTEGAWELNIGAFVVGWLIFTGVLWLVWLAIHSIRRSGIRQAQGSEIATPGERDGRGTE